MMAPPTDPTSRNESSSTMPPAVEEPLSTVAASDDRPRASREKSIMSTSSSTKRLCFRTVYNRYGVQARDLATWMLADDLDETA